MASGNVNTITTDNKLSESYHFSTNNSAVLAQVWGKNMTAAEYMEKVYPGSLEALPKDAVERLKKEPMLWPSPKDIQPSENLFNATKSSESNNVSGKVTP